MASKLLLLSAALFGLAACTVKNEVANKNLSTEFGEIKLESLELSADAARFAWNYPAYPSQYQVDPLDRGVPFSNRGLAEGGSLAGPWLEGDEMKELPVDLPNVINGDRIAVALEGRLTPELLPKEDDTPFVAYLRLKNGLKDAQVSGLPITEEEIWDLTMALYRRLSPDFTKPIKTRLVPDAAPQNGSAIYGANCAMCHSADATGRGHAAKSLYPKPANFHQLRRLFNRSNVQLRLVLQNGVFGTGMPPWGDKLGDQEIEWLIGYLRSFSYSSEPPVGTRGESQ